jgi:hypothetical protein
LKLGQTELQKGNLLRGKCGIQLLYNGSLDNCIVTTALKQAAKLANGGQCGQNDRIPSVRQGPAGAAAVSIAEGHSCSKGRKECNTSNGSADLCGEVEE